MIHLPTEPGVYDAQASKYTTTIQLAEDGTWWPHPYRFSGWRPVEVAQMEDLKLRPDLTLDVPPVELRDPERVARNKLAEALLDEYYAARSIVSMFRSESIPDHPASQRLAASRQAILDFLVASAPLLE